MATDSIVYACDADVEPLHRYRPGGYHPIHIGDTLDGKYTVLNKLGWGSFSTVWAVLDLQCFALKAVVSERYRQGQEIDIMQKMASFDPHQTGFRHLLLKHDSFRLHGPNGMHDCLVLDLAGPSIPETIEQNFGGKRLPARLARRLSKQIVLGTACLHQQGIAHGDLHTGNIVLSSASTLKLSDPAWWSDRHVEMEPVTRKDQRPISSDVPRYLVRSISLPLGSPSQCLAKIADYGEAFASGRKPTQSRTPLVVRAPEAIFNDQIDSQADLWSLGCILFELVTGQPPFDSIMVTPVSLVGQILETTGESLPEKWQPLRLAMAGDESFSKPGVRLQEWLEDVYFDGEQEAGFSREDIQELGRIIQRLLHLEPAERASAKEILEEPWFEDIDMCAV